MFTHSLNSYISSGPNWLTVHSLSDSRMACVCRVCVMWWSVWVHSCSDFQRYSTCGKLDSFCMYSQLHQVETDVCSTLWLSLSFRLLDHNHERLCSKGYWPRVYWASHWTLQRLWSRDGPIGLQCVCHCCVQVRPRHHLSDGQETKRELPGTHVLPPPETPQHVLQPVENNQRRSVPTGTDDILQTFTQFNSDSAANLFISIKIQMSSGWHIHIQTLATDYRPVYFLLKEQFAQKQMASRAVCKLGLWCFGTFQS